MDEIKRLYCAVCGAVTMGRQFHNQDTGHGLCVECAERLKTRFTESGGQRGMDDAAIERCYGKRGEHWGLVVQLRYLPFICARFPDSRPGRVEEHFATREEAIARFEALKADVEDAALYFENGHVETLKEH